MAQQRVHSIDILRGIVMILMLLGHAIHFFYKMEYSPTDLTQTNVLFFFSRWITHICAPAFVFLAGVSIYIIISKTNNKKSTSIFLVKRGLWLVFLEISILSFFWTSLFNYIQLQVIWTIGIAFLFMSFLIYLPWAINLAIAIGIILFHNLLDMVNFEAISFGWKTVLILLHAPVELSITDSVTINVLYSILPYVGIMLLGYCMGRIIHLTSRIRKRLLLLSGFGMILLFILLKIINIYGDPYTWSIQERGAIFTVISFLNVTKYPPSLQFILLTLGMSFIILAWLEKSSNDRFKNIEILGQVAMFFYLFHIPFTRVAAKVYWALFDSNPSLFVFSLLWLVMILILTYVSKVYGRFKASRKGDKQYWWLRYV